MTIVLAGSDRPVQRERLYLKEVEAKLRAGDQKGAMSLAAEAVSKGCAHLKLLTLAAFEHLNRGEPEAALQCATQARALGPRDPDALNALGLCLSRVGRFGEALPVFDAALRQAPNAAHLHFYKGRALEDMNETARARRQYERTLDLQPAHAEALARLAWLAGLRGDIQAARNYAGRALNGAARNPAAALAVALADIGDEKFEQAIHRLKALAASKDLSALNRAIALGLSGDALDGMDQVSAAFAAYTESNSMLRDLYRPVYEAPGVETAAQRASRILSWLRARPDARSWPDPSTLSGKAPVFLVGFPRSGTTLLEQILAAHADVEAMSERDCLFEAAGEFILQPDGLERLSALRGREVQKYREAYWARVARHGHAANRPVFVDKMPLNSVLLCLVAKIFPEAKILFAHRDPRDVVLSCFRRRFVMTAQMYELLTLEGAARYYDLVMQLGTMAASRFSLNVHWLRHEDLVGDFAQETRRLCEFLGVAQHSDMDSFATAARRNDIDTPSAAQVTRGLSARGIDQWRRYRDQLAPIMPVLAPWVSRFGYEEA